MHRLIMNAPKDKDVDHRDRNPLNNQRRNLRFATTSQNAANRKVSVKNKSGFKGVCWNRWTGKWNAYLYVGGKGFNLGNFDDKMEAVRVRQLAFKKAFGEFAVNN